MEELNLLISNDQWKNNAKDISYLLTGYSSPKIVQLVSNIIKKRFLDEKLLLKLFIAKKNKIPLDFFYEILESHQGSLFYYSSPKHLINMRFSLLQLQLISSEEALSLSQVYHLVFLDQEAKKSFLSQNSNKDKIIHYQNEEQFISEIKEAIKKNSHIFVIWDRLPSSIENQLIKQSNHDFWIKIIFHPKNQYEDFCELEILNRLEQKPYFKSFIATIFNSGVLSRYYPERDDYRFILDMIDKRYIPKSYESLFFNTSIAYPSQWVQLLIDRRFTLEELGRVSMISQFIGLSKLKKILLNNDLSDIMSAFSVISALTTSLQNSNLLQIYNFLKKQRIQTFKDIESSLFLLQHKKFISNHKYTLQSYIQSWEHENDEAWDWIVPLTSDELFDWGYKLRNCLNDTEFHKKMLEKNQYIVIGRNKLNKKYFVCIRINIISGEITEMKARNNSTVGDEDSAIISNKITAIFNKTFNVSI